MQKIANYNRRNFIKLFLDQIEFAFYHSSIFLGWPFSSLSSLGLLYKMFTSICNNKVWQASMFLTLSYFPTWGQCYKTFYIHKLQKFVIIGRLSLASFSSLAGKAAAYPSESPFSFSPLGKAVGLVVNITLGWKNFYRDKHSSLLWKFINFSRKFL